MTAREHDEIQSPEREDDRAALAPIARDAAHVLRRMVMEMQPGHDLGAIFARARELDPTVVTPERVAEAERLMEAKPLAPSRQTEGDAVVLAPFASALRGEIVAGIQGQRVCPPPTLRRSRFGLFAGLVAAAAAAVLLTTFGPELAELRRGELNGVEANADGEAARGHGSAPLIGPPPPRPTPVRKDIRVFDLPPPTLEAPELPPAPLPEPPPPVPEVRRAAPVARPHKAASAVDTATLEDQAQALWQAGELAAAEAKYREIVRIAGTSQRAEFAYGDLFALSRQRRGSAGQVATWREYLVAFPDGQFADDAHAGLCQRGPADEAETCWQDYLERHPRGAHRSQADAALGEALAPGG